MYLGVDVLYDRFLFKDQMQHFQPIKTNMQMLHSYSWKVWKGGFGKSGVNDSFSHFKLLYYNFMAPILNTTVENMVSICFYDIGFMFLKPRLWG